MARESLRLQEARTLRLVALVLLTSLSAVLAVDIAREENPNTLLAISKENSEKIATAKTPAERAEFSRVSLEAAERAKQLAPRNAKVRLNLAIVYGRLAQEESPRRRIEMSALVKEETEASLELDPKDPLAWHILGRWNYEMSSLNPLLKAIAQAVFGRFPDASNARAIECFEKSRALNPSWAVNELELGRAYAAGGKTDLAREHITRGLEMPDTSTEADQARTRARKTLDALAENPATP